MLSPTVTAIATRRGEAPAARSPQAASYLSSNPLSQNPHDSDPTDLRDDYLAKSEAAAARWSGSERKIARARQQELNTNRRSKAALLRVFDVVAAVEEEEAAEEGASDDPIEDVFEEDTSEDDNEEEFDNEDYIEEFYAERQHGLTGENE